MMDDKQLDELLTDAKRSYRAPPNAPLDAIYSRVDAELFAEKLSKPAPGWSTFAGAIAATLVLGVLIGRNTAAREIALPFAPKQTATPAQLASNTAAAPYQRTMQEFLGSTAVLIAALPANGRPGTNDTKIAEQARALLGTARLLLDSPVGREQRTRDLLEDLELVLAQVARLQSQRPGEALTMINESLEERDVVPRIRTAVAGLSIGDY
jgi:hypothetical protein